MKATATDQGSEPNMSQIHVEVLVVDSNKKAPSFQSAAERTIHLKENFSDFTTPIATLSAV
jgi:hypothetical protein